MNQQIIFKSINENKDHLRKIGITRIGLFGSYIRNENTDDSDVDIIIEFDEEKKNFHNYMEACDFLEKIISRKVDIVTPESISPYIKPYIEKEVIYERL